MSRRPDATSNILMRVSGWSLAFGVLALALVALIAGFWSTAESLVHTWAGDGTYQYAFLIFPLSAWLAFSLRHRLRANAPTPSVWGLLAVMVLLCIWYTGQLLDINLVRHFAFVALFPALVLACWGWRALRVLAFPLGYLAFAVPWGDGLVGPLQDITAHFAVHALNLTGTPVLLNGREIVTPVAVWMVADACSGVKFLFACMALGCLFAYLMYERWWKRVLFVVLATVVPIIANGLRVFFTVLIGEIWGLQYATGTDHLIFGWQFFGTVLVLLLLAGWFFRDHLLPVARYPIAAGMPVRMRRLIWPALIVLLLVTPVLAATVASSAPPQAVRLLPPVVPGWGAPQRAGPDWRPVFKGAAGEYHAAYQAPGDAASVELFHALYTGKPRRDHTLITYGNDLHDPARSHVLSTANVRVESAMRATLARELRLAGAMPPRLVWYWYCVDDRCTRSPVVVKLLQAWDVLRGQTPRSSVWALSTQIARGDAASGRARLRAFAQALPATAAADDVP